MLFADAYELCRPISDERVQAKVGLSERRPATDAHRQLSVVGHIVFRPSSVLRLLALFFASSLRSRVGPSTAFLLPEVSFWQFFFPVQQAADFFE